MKTLKFFFCVVMVVVATGCGKKESNTTEVTDTARIEQVKTQILKLEEIERNIDYSTTLEGYEVVNIAPSLTGKIEHIFVEVGDNVKKGDDLVRMDQTQYNTTNLTFTNLIVEMDRMKALRETGSVSQQKYDQTKLSYDQTKENLEFLRKNTFVKAPFSGVITAKNYEDGELYGGQAIVVLQQINMLKAIVNIPETYFPRLKSGMEVAICCDIYPNEKFAASIEVIYPTIDVTTHNFQVKLKIPNPSLKLRPGMFAHSKFSFGKEKAMIVPFQSVLKLQGSDERYIFLAENGKAKRVPVKLGQRFDDMIEIVSDKLKSGDAVIVVGQARLIDGISINVVK